jgi:two-component system NtrC family response regulator
MEKLLIVEDDLEVSSLMGWALAGQYDVLSARDRDSAVDILRGERPCIATLDLGLPPSPDDTREGLRALHDMLELDPHLKVVVITGQDERENAMAAVGQGAYDFFCKPIDIESLKVVLGRAVFVYRVENDNREQLRTKQHQAFEGMVGASPRMQQVFDSIRKVAGSEAPVLISGESGTGKELAARAIYRMSRRNTGPFVAINCGAIPENLLESELFGHEKGSFTGAHMQRQGRIEAAHGGTLFLDEIGELSPALQVKLLRFLQEKQIERVGGRRSIEVDTRIITATNADLRKGMAEGRFREDLYYRIAVVVISMPPLREREGDIPLLAEFLLQKLAADQKKNVVFAQKALEAMQSYPWPGNVRELENRIRRAVIMAAGTQISVKDLQLSRAYAAYDSMGLFEARDQLEKELIESAIARNKGNLTRCAEDLKISRPALYEIIQKLGIQRK